MEYFLTWLDMGGYASYIWSGYAIFIGVFGINFFSAKRRNKLVQKKLQRWFYYSEQD